MDGRKALFSRRSHSYQEHYSYLISGEEGSSSTELHNISFNDDGSAYDGSVFTDNTKEKEEGRNSYGRTVAGVLDVRNGQSARSTSSVQPRSVPLSRPSSTRKPRSYSYGSDHVDMPIASSKNVSKGPKRRSSENRDFVYNFNWFDILIGVGSILVYFVDIITDIKLAVDYFLESEWVFGGVTTALIVGPSLVTCCFGLHWYIIDYRMEKKVISKYTKCNDYFHVTPARVWFYRFFFTALQCGPVVRTVEYLHYGMKSRSKHLNEKERRRFHWWMLYEDVDNCLLRLFESFLESAPQLSWQLYITIVRNTDDDLIGTTTRAAALLSSWCSLAVSLVSYHRSLRNSREDKNKMHLLSMPFYFIWRACEVGGRILCIAMFASAFDMWVFGILLLHWVVISGWLMNQRTTFYAHRCLERVFNIICGYVMLFCFLNLREGHTRYRFLIFYIIFYIENFFMLAFWFRFTTDLGTWYHLWGFIVVLIFFILHVIFQLLYYSCFHPTGTIEYCLSCDKYTFYESVCYDVRPELDDGVGSPSPRYTGQELNVSNSLPELVVAAGTATDAVKCEEISVVVDHDKNEKRPIGGTGEHGIIHQDRACSQLVHGRQKDRHKVSDI